MGPIAGIAVVIFENLYFFAKSFVLRKNRYKTVVEHWLINSHNFASSFVSVFIAHFVVLLVGHESWVLMIILPVVTIVADIFQLKFFGTLRLLLSLYRGTELPPRQQKIALLRDMANSYMYYIYIAFGPILLYFSYTQNGLAGLILALIILIPSQATGLLYMQLKDKQAELFTDELTGINNSMKFRTDMENLLSKPKPYVLIMFDLDEFKKVNDQYGHLFGNEALTLFSKLISGFTDNRADSCMVYRLHGDEFVMLIPDVARSTEIIDRLNNLISTYAIDYQGGLVKLSFSGGAALVPPGTPARDALQQADIVLYKAKSAGRGRVLFEENVSLP